MSSNRLVFFGNERLASGLAPIQPIVLPALIEEGYDIAAVVSNYSEGRSRSSRPLEVAEVADKHKIPLLLPAKLGDIADQLKATGAKSAVLVAYGQIVPRSILELFPRGIINIHPSLLPAYRGPTPIEQAILDGPEQTGVSLMKLAPAMDAGPVYAQQSLPLRGDETKVELAESLLRAGSSLLIQNLAAILDGSLKPKPQVDKQATYTKLLSKSDGQLDFKQPAEVLERQVRAFAGFPKARAQIEDQDVVVTAARVAKTADDGDLVIACQPGWLEILELTAPSGKTITGAEFIRGYKRL